MQVAWVHNFAKERAHGSGVFLWQLRDRLEMDGITIKDVFVGNLRTPSDLANASSTIKNAVDDCDLFHTQFGSLCGFVASRVPGKKILSLRGSDWYVIPPGISHSARLHSIAANFFTKRSLLKYDKIITVSKKMATEVRHHQSRLKPDVIPSGIDFKKFYPMDRMQCRAKLGKADDKRPWVLFSSVLDDNALKRKSLALAAVEVAKKTIPDMAVTYLTNIPHEMVSVHINAADVVLLTSTHEGWPNIVKEGLACDVPFVSTDVSDLGEIALASHNCYVTDPTPETLGAALVQSLIGAREKGLSDLISDMELSNTAQKLIKIYEAVGVKNNQ